MRLPRRARLPIAVLLLLVVYIGSYAALSAAGGRQMSQTGKLRYGFGLAVTDVERWQPAWAYWEPFRDVSGEDTSRGNFPGYIYSPLIRMDRRLFHPDRNLFPAIQPTD